MKVLVTGGCGFIGSSLTKELVRLGYEVDVVDNMSSGSLSSLDGLNIRVTFADFLEEFMSKTSSRKDATVIQGDFSHSSVLDLVSSGIYDVIFHQAAIPRVLYSVENPYETSDINILRSTALLEACKNTNTRFIFASSSSVYGGAETLPTSESMHKNPKSPYAWQKSSFEELIKIFSNLYGTDAICLRYFNVFGPGQLGDSPYSTSVAAWCNAIKESSNLRSDGDGEQTRDLCYIDNIVNANILAANSSKKFSGECYNIACGDQTSNNEILQYFLNNFNNIKVTHAPERLGDVKHTCADITRARDDLGYIPIVHFWEGLKKTIEWWGIDELDAL